MTASLPPSWSTAEVCAALHISPKALGRLIAAGRVGCYRAGRSRRYLPEHVAQIVAALEVKPRAEAPDVLAQIGVTGRGAAMRRTA